MTRPRTFLAGSPLRRTWSSAALGPAAAGSLDGDPIEVGAGRGLVSRVQLGPFTALVRTYRRGGLFGSVLPDVFTRADRALAEVEALERLAALGLSPRPLMLEIHGGMFVRLRIAVEEVEGAANLLEAARAGASIDAGLARRIGNVVRRMHEAGVSHRDLNVGNILVRGVGAAAQIFVVDLDGARLFDDPVPPSRRSAEILRLCRSLDKWTATSGTRAAARAAFLRAALPPGERLAVLRRARRLHSIRAFLGRRPR